MNKFSVLFKHELKMQFPLKPGKRKIDVLGTVLSVLMVLLIATAFVVLLSAVASNYVLVKMNKVSDPMLRAKEMLNLCYTVSIIALVLACLENMRRTLTHKKDRELFLRLPVKQQTIFISKLATLMIWNYILAFLVIVPINMIFYLSVELEPTFWLMTLPIWLLMPMAVFLIATLLLVPYIKLIDFISNKYALMFVIITVIIGAAFLLYSKFLGIMQSLLETGSIKFLFNEEFILGMQRLLKWSYPANCFANMALGDRLGTSFIIAGAVALVAPVVAYLISKQLFYATLYKNESKKQSAKKPDRCVKLPPLVSLIKKEFITIFREPKNLFSYFAIAASMPIMVYCCYTMFESLIVNMIGITVSFPLAVLVVMIFSILTNTFCSTNVTRDGVAAIKAKIFPVKATTILFAKVLLCLAVSSLSILVSLIVLAIATSLTFGDAMICALIGVAFSCAQIFIATRMDLNGAVLSSSLQEMKSTNNKTIAKVVSVGLLLALVMGILSVMAYILSMGSKIAFIQKLGLQPVHAYVFPAVISAAYLVFALIYYSVRIKKSLDNLTI